MFAARKSEPGRVMLIMMGAGRHIISILLLFAQPQATQLPAPVSTRLSVVLTAKPRPGRRRKQGNGKDRNYDATS